MCSLTALEGKYHFNCFRERLRDYSIRSRSRIQAAGVRILNIPLVGSTNLGTLLKLPDSVSCMKNGDNDGNVFQGKVAGT